MGPVFIFAYFLHLLSQSSQNCRPFKVMFLKSSLDLTIYRHTNKNIFKNSFIQNQLELFQRIFSFILVLEYSSCLESGVI